MTGPVLEVLNDCILITNENKYDQNDQKCSLELEISATTLDSLPTNKYK
jgi:hypothetical protein